MVDINLLPEDLRGKEEKEKKAAGKIPHVFDIRLTAAEKTEKAPKKSEEDKGGFLKKILKRGQRPEGPAEGGAYPERRPLLGEEKIRFHLPEMQKIKSAAPKESFKFRREAPARQEAPAEKKEIIKNKAPKKFENNKKGEEVFEIKKTTPIEKAGREGKKSWFKKLSERFKFRKKEPSNLKPKLEFAEKDFRRPKAKVKKVKKTRFEINLIPEELVKHPNLNLGRKFSILAIAIAVTVITILSAREVIKLRQFDIKDKIKEVEINVAKLQRRVDELSEQRERITKLKEKFLLIETMLKNHLYWTKIFEALETYTIDDVYYISFSATAEGSLSLSAMGKDYESVARQLVAFQEAADFVRDVSITTASAQFDEGEHLKGVSFDINLKLVKDIYLLKFAKENNE